MLNEFEIKINKENFENMGDDKIFTGKLNSIILKDTSDVSSLLIHKNMLIVSSYQSIKIFDLETKNIFAKNNNAHKNCYINSMIVLKNTEILISSSTDCYIKFWNISNLTELEARRINNNSQVLEMIQYDNYTIIASSRDNSIKFYDLKTKFLRYYMKWENDYIWRFLILNNSNIFITGSRGGKIKVWKNFKCIKDIPNSDFNTIYSLIQLDFNRNVIVSADNLGNIKFREINNNEFKLIRHITRSEYSNDSRFTDSLCLYEMKREKILISASYYSQLTFWSLVNYPECAIIRNVKLREGLYCIVSTENEKNLVFNLGNHVVLWN